MRNISKETEFRLVQFFYIPNVLFLVFKRFLHFYSSMIGPHYIIKKANRNDNIDKISPDRFVKRRKNGYVKTIFRLVHIINSCRFYNQGIVTR